MLTVKYVSLADRPRLISGDWPVMAVGNSRGNAPVCALSGVFPDMTEISVRILAPDSPPNSRARMILGGREYNIGYPHVVVKPAKTAYIYQELAERDVHFFAYGLELRPRLESLGLGMDELAWEVSLEPETMVAIRRLESLMDNALAWGNIDRIDSLCWNLLVEFLVQRQTKVPSFTEDRMQMLRVAAWMRTHCGEALTLDSVVRQFNLSRTSFFRKWSRCFSDTPGQYLQGLRLQEARRLLKATELRVFEIAERLNYPSASYFSAVFRQEYGLTPFAYRKSKDMP